MATPHRKGAVIDQLTKFQRELIQLFFTLPSAKNFVLAGGGALLVHRLTNRITHDLDFFGINQTTKLSLLLSEFAFDSPPQWPITETALGPTFDIRDLAGRKVAALFNRAEARDFVDVFLLTNIFTQRELVQFAQKIDIGFTHPQFKESLKSLNRYQDTELPIAPGQIDALRSFFSEWIAELDR